MKRLIFAEEPIDNKTSKFTCCGCILNYDNYTCQACPDDDFAFDDIPLPNCPFTKSTDSNYRKAMELLSSAVSSINSRDKKQALMVEALDLLRGLDGTEKKTDGCGTRDCQKTH